VVRTFEVEAGTLRRSFTDATLAEASARLPAGSYTSLRTYGGSRVLRIGQHVSRLVESLAFQGGAARLSEADVRHALATALGACGHAESRVRITFAPPRLFVSVEPFAPLADSLYANGAGCVTLPLRRSNPHAKDTRFIATASEAYARLPPGAHEGLLIGEGGEILEGLSSNFFGVVGGVLRTEAERVLPGVTRSQVLELARGVVDVSSTAVRTSELPSLQEAFLTSASRGVLPVARIDDLAVGAGRPGPVTRDLMARFEAFAESEAEDLLASA
jgi:branched-chain amino acid aminotransferase